MLRAVDAQSHRAALNRRQCHPPDRIGILQRIARRCLAGHNELSLQLLKERGHAPPLFFRTRSVQRSTRTTLNVILYSQLGISRVAHEIAQVPSQMDANMSSMVVAGALLAVLSGVMNGTFTLPMRFLGKWEWENVWSLFIAFACLVMPTTILAVMAPQSWHVIATAPTQAILVALATGFAWGFGAILFGQSVSAIGIS